MNYNNIILLSDLDGTLLDDNSNVSEENSQAIKEFIEKGGRFGIATGRTQLNVVSFLQDIPLNVPCILYNGGGLYDFDTKKFICLIELQKKGLVEYLQFCLNEFKDVMIQIYNPEMCYIVSSKELADPIAIADNKPCEFCRFEDMLDKPWIKILFSGKKEDLKSIKNEIETFGLEDQINWVFSSEKYLEFLPNQVSKGSMLRRLREHLGNKYQVYAVGDYHNDKEMIREADVGIAVENAHLSLKGIADRVTVSNNMSAIAHIITYINKNQRVDNRLV